MVLSSAGSTVWRQTRGGLLERCQRLSERFNPAAVLNGAKDLPFSSTLPAERNDAARAARQTGPSRLSNRQRAVRDRAVSSMMASG
jgi:hypothetical protein